MVSVWKNSRALLIRKPMPVVALMVSAKTRISQDDPDGVAQADQRRWARRAGRTTWRTSAEPAQAECPPGLDQRRVGAPDAGEQVQVEREEHARARSGSVLGWSPMPNQMISSGIRPTTGTVRSIWIGASMMSSPTLNSPEIRAAITAAVNPKKRPRPTRWRRRPRWPPAVRRTAAVRRPWRRPAAVGPGCAPTTTRIELATYQASSNSTRADRLDQPPWNRAMAA